MCEASELLHADGEIIMSVPHMVGPSFLLQRLGLWLTRSRREPISLHDLERAVVHADTDALEADWEPEKHLGFNHRKLERTMRAAASGCCSRPSISSAGRTVPHAASAEVTARRPDGPPEAGCCPTHRGAAQTDRLWALVRRWMVFRSMPATRAACEMLPLCRRRSEVR